MKLTKIASVSAIIVFAATSVYAAELPKFKDLDGDGDKGLTEAEYAKAKDAGVEKTFGELDKNKDGKLDLNEYSVVLDEDCE
jgi:hypothetical protein